MSTEKSKILFLCTGNSCRSQMAVGWAKHFKSDEFEAYSAGVEKHGLNPYAVKVMKEAGVDLSKQYSKTVDELDNTDFDYVIILCDSEKESCPVFFGNAKIIHHGFDNPPALVKHISGEEEKLNCYRRVRDEIRVFLEGLLVKKV